MKLAKRTSRKFSTHVKIGGGGETEGKTVKGERVQEKYCFLDLVLER